MPNFLDRPDGRLAYDINGSGPPLLLVTGLGGSRRYWANVVPALAREFTVITHDHMGIGDSQGTRTRTRWKPWPMTSWH
jgi:aminoacrylate hydrolase